MIIGGDNSGYAARDISPRNDGNGKEFIYARAHGALTAKTAYVARVAHDGWRTLAVFDTGMASTTAASHLQYVAFVPDAAIASDTDGWGQCGGVCTSVTLASQSATTGNIFIWSDATITGATAATATVVMHSGYGICMATASGGTYDIYLRGVTALICGQT